jgi:AraC-like DNA-binding protein
VPIDSNDQIRAYSLRQTTIQVSSLWAAVCSGGNPTTIAEATRQLIDKLLLERLALAAIARVTGVSERWLQLYVNQKFDQTPKTIEVTPKNWVG